MGEDVLHGCPVWPPKPHPKALVQPLKPHPKALDYPVARMWGCLVDNKLKEQLLEASSFPPYNEDLNNSKSRSKELIIEMEEEQRRQAIK
jgi:hypothetical protein